MSVQVMVALPDQVYRRAVSLARLTSQDVPKLLTDTIEMSLPSVTALASVAPVSELSDDSVLALADSQMEPDLDKRLSVLLGKQQDGELLEVERRELAALMQAYHEGLLRKAQALAEAVRRGLMEPLKP
ncbi:MAG: hypothetical protein WA040_13235 [Anaerolineae bacterium]